MVFTNKENGTNRLGGGINSVNYAANEKKKDFLRSGKMVVKEDYTLAKQTVFAAKKKAEIEKLDSVENEDVTDFHIAKQKTKTLLVKNAYKMILES